MVDQPFVSFAQNREDVVLHRVLGHVETGRYVDVGANDPTEDSVSRAFYDAGWRGITVEPVSEDAEALRRERPGDRVIEAAITGHDGGTVELLQVSDSRLSTLVDAVGNAHFEHGWAVERRQVASRRLDSVLAEAGWDDGRDIHFLSVDTEGAEQQVLSSLDLRCYRPWVIVVEATKPQSTEPSHHGWEPMVLEAGYRFGLFDGLSRFYVAEERWDELGDRLAAPANVLDTYVTAREHVREAELHRLARAAADLESARQGLLAERDSLRSAAEHYRVTGEATRREADDDRQAAKERARRDGAAILRWRSAALGAWSRAATGGGPGGAALNDGSLAELQWLRANNHAVTQELAAVRATLSWRITKPLRLVRRVTRLGR